MSQRSSIEWTDGTWNFVVGCDKLSPGCAGCYAVKDVLRMGSNPNPKVTAANRGLAYRQANGILNWAGAVRLMPERLALPFDWPTPKTVFVNSLSDLFHAQVPPAFIRRAFAVMAATPWHTYQVLTKRAERLAALAPCLDWPANVWMRVSVESQPYAVRADHLRRTGARVKFLSVEPLLGPVKLDLAGLDWVITGGESGPRARPFDPAWALAVRDQCRAAGARFFHKQNGGRNEKATGRPLAGRSYDEMPEVFAVPVPPARDRRRLAAAFTPPAPAGRVSLTLTDPSFAVDRPAADPF
ncbi:MAG: phage Gp37/Gp68 family protein [Gemmataceae bacterium]|nr:phage Gp37/Gp68 family protein [Gemmataceae bacterium]